MYLFTMRIGDSDVVLGTATGNNPVSAFEMLAPLLARRNMKLDRESIRVYRLAEGETIGTPFVP
jgi:hypothetical protein